MTSSLYIKEQLCQKKERKEPQIFPSGIRQPGLWIWEFSSGIQDSYWKWESGIHNVESRIQDWFGLPHMGRHQPNQQLQVTFIKHYSSIPISFSSSRPFPLFFPTFDMDKLRKERL